VPKLFVSHRNIALTTPKDDTVAHELTHAVDDFKYLVMIKHLATHGVIFREAQEGEGGRLPGVVAGAIRRKLICLS